MTNQYDKFSEFGKRLYTFIEAAGYPTMTAFAEEIGMTTANLQRYLKGDRKPGFEILERIKDAGCSIDYLMEQGSTKKEMFDEDTPIGAVLKSSKEASKYLQRLRYLYEYHRYTFSSLSREQFEQIQVLCEISEFGLAVDEKINKSRTPPLRIPMLITAFSSVIRRIQDFAKTFSALNFSAGLLNVEYAKEYAKKNVGLYPVDIYHSLEEDWDEIGGWQITSTEGWLMGMTLGVLLMDNDVEDFEQKEIGESIGLEATSVPSIFRLVGALGLHHGNFDKTFFCMSLGYSTLVAQIKIFTNSFDHLKSDSFSTFTRERQLFIVGELIISAHSVLKMQKNIASIVSYMLALVVILKHFWDTPEYEKFKTFSDSICKQIEHFPNAVPEAKQQDLTPEDIALLKQIIAAHKQAGQ